MGTIGKRSDWTELIPSNVVHRETPGINPTNPGPGNQYHLRIQHLNGGSELPTGLLLKNHVVNSLTSNAVRMTLWSKPIFGSSNAEHVAWLLWRSGFLGQDPPNSTPLLGVTSNPVSGDVTLYWGRFIPGSELPIIDGSKILTTLTPGDVVGMKGWVVDVGINETQFYVQWYNGTAWEKAANYVLPGAEGVIGKYYVTLQTSEDFGQDDEDWFDDFEFTEDESPPEAPP